MNDGNALDQNYADHFHDYLGQIPELLALTLMILILAILKVKVIALNTTAYSADIDDL